MGYCALLIPQEVKTETTKKSLFSNIKDKLCSGLKTGGLSFENATTVFKNTASLISEGTDLVANKFSGIALTQLLANGKITNETALNYLKQGFPKALNQSSISLGFQSVEQLENALKNKNGVNVQQFISAFQNFGSAFSQFTKQNSIRQNIEGYEIIEIDAVTNDNRSYQSETPDRRVEKGQTYQEYIHNMPDIITLECLLQEGRNYTSNDFEDILLNIRGRKIAIDVILGDVIKKNLVLTNFSPVRTGRGGLSYSLEFKKIEVGSVELVSLSIGTSAIKGIVKNSLNPTDSKTQTEKSLGWWDKTKQNLNKDITLDRLKGLF